MFPDSFGPVDAYVVLMLVGMALALCVAVLYLKKENTKVNSIIDFLLCGVVALISGVVFATLFENLYEAIKYGDKYLWTWGMTFYGGLIGGVGGFLLMYHLFYKKHNAPIMDKLLIIAPACISLAHAIGRIGCLIDGCCYGRVTTSKFGVIFPALHDGLYRIPTQLYESIFLFLLSGVLLILAITKKFKYTMPLYLGVYAIFRFIIEFYRGDDRGTFFFGLVSPSQFWCIIILLGVAPLVLFERKFIFKKEEKVDEEKTVS